MDTGTKRENYLAWLSFLNNDAKLKHNNLHAASVFVRLAGDWKLAGLESVSGVDQDPPLHILPSPNITSIVPPG